MGSAGVFRVKACSCAEGGVLTFPRLGVRRNLPFKPPPPPRPQELPPEGAAPTGPTTNLVPGDPEPQAGQGQGRACVLPSTRTIPAPLD